MVATTKALLFFGIASSDRPLWDAAAYDLWSSVYEEQVENAEHQGLVIESLTDGAITGYFLAVKASVEMVSAGAAKLVSSVGLVASPLWQQQICAFAQTAGLPVAQPPGWRLACRMDGHIEADE